MRSFKNYFLVLFVLAMLPALNAQTMPCPGNFGVSAEWLYMLTGIDQPYYAASYEEASFTSNAKRISPDHCWHSGYRIDLIYSFCDCFNEARIRWTHFPSFSHSEEVNGFLTPLFPEYAGLDGQFVPSNLFASEVTFQDTFDFYYLDFLLGRKTIDCNCFMLELQGGIQYGHLSLEEETSFTFPSSASGSPIQLIDKAKSHLWGIGPEISTELSYFLGNCFSLTGRGCGALLISKREVKRQTFEDISGDPEPSDITYNIEDSDYWKVIPTLDLRFGLSFSRAFDACFCFGPFNVDLEVGYEAVWFFQGIERIYNMINRPVNARNNQSPPDDTLNELFWGVNFDQLRTFSLHGLYIHAGIGF